jgi:coatomer protein complex subunit alpha (xenin)
MVYVSCPHFISILTESIYFLSFFIYLLVDQISISVGERKAGCLLQPPTPIIRAKNWPTIPVQKTTLEDLEAAEASYKLEEDDADSDMIMKPVVTSKSKVSASSASAPKSTWDNSGYDFSSGTNPTKAVTSALDDLNLGDSDDLGDWGDDFDLGDDGTDHVHPTSKRDTEMSSVSYMDGTDSGFEMPTSGRPPAACWIANSSHAAVHIAAGQAASAMQLLNRQVAVSDFSKLKDSMIGCYLGSSVSVPGVSGCGSTSIPLLQNDQSKYPGQDSLPRCYLKLAQLVDGIRTGYRNFQAGKFNDALTAFKDVLGEIPLVVTENKNEANEMKEMLEICREYITAIRIKGAIGECEEDPKRSTELSAYFTHCNLQPSHLLLALRAAMGTAFKHKNFICSASFARRLLELPDMSSERNADLRSKATKVLQKSEQMARNEVSLNYNESTSFVIDCKSLAPIYSGDKMVKCSFCGSSYSGETMKNKICVTCGFCTVGVETIGLVTGS